MGKKINTGKKNSSFKSGDYREHEKMIGAKVVIKGYISFILNSGVEHEYP